MRACHTGAPEHCLQLVQALKGGNLVGLSEGGVGNHAGLTNRVNTVFTYPTLAEAYKIATFEGLDRL